MEQLENILETFNFNPSCLSKAEIQMVIDEGNNCSDSVDVNTLEYAKFVLKNM